MKTITITDAKYQDKINELRKALVHLREAMTIIKALIPNKNDFIERPVFCDEYLRAESNCSSTICDVSSVLSELVREEITDIYL